MTITPRLRAPLMVVLVLALLCSVPGSTQAAPKVDEQVTLVRSEPNRDLLASLRSYIELMTMLSVDTGYRVGSKAPRETGRTDCPVDRCRDYKLKVPAGVKVSHSTVRVVLPRGYDLPRNAKRRYPVVFLWNGARSRFDGWTYKTELLEMSKKWRAILVMPDGGVGDDAGMNSDWIDGSYDWETFHTKVVVPWADRRFRTIPGARAAIGASMGGIGVVNYAAHNPGMFKAFLSISGAVDTTTMAANTIGPELEELLGFPPPDLRRVWGDPVLNRDVWDAHNPAAQVDKLRGVRIFIASGTGFADDPNKEDVYSGTFENQLWTMHRTFLLALTAAKVPYEARVSVGGIHDWRWFNKPLRWGVPKMLKVLRGR